MKKHPHACNIVDLTPDRTDVWSFSFRGRKPIVGTSKSVAPGGKLPGPVLSRGWQHLLSPSVNIGLLPGGDVYLRVVHLPTDDEAEVASMLEWQIEKISPLPMTQCAWSYEIIPDSDKNSITVVVLIAERKSIEQLLGRFEDQGFLADRLVLPQLSRLRAMKISGDGTWLLPETRPDGNFCLVAWHYGGALRHLAVLVLTKDEDWVETISREMVQQAWSAEIEGWLQVEPEFHIVSTGTDFDRWSMVAERLGRCDLIEDGSMAGERLAATIAKDASNGQTANLMLSDVASRYRQRFVDSLWLKAVGAVLVLYLLGVAGYFAALEWSKYKRDEVQLELAGLGGSYTNALQLKEQIKVLDKQERLKFAALDSWKTVVEVLPSELYFRRFEFRSGTTLTISGGAPSNSSGKVTSYKEALETIVVNERPLFSIVREKNRAQTRGALTWNVECELAESLDK